MDKILLLLAYFIISSMHGYFCDTCYKIGDKNILMRIIYGMLVNLSFLSMYMAIYYIQEDSFMSVIVAVHTSITVNFIVNALNNMQD